MAVVSSLRTTKLLLRPSPQLSQTQNVICMLCCKKRGHSVRRSSQLTTKSLFSKGTWSAVKPKDIGARRALLFFQAHACRLDELLKGTTRTKLLL